MKTSRCHRSHTDEHRVMKCPPKEDSQAVEVETEKLEDLANLVDELVLVPNQLRKVYDDLVVDKAGLTSIVKQNPA